MTTTPEQLRRLIEESRHALEGADRTLRNIDETLQRSDRVQREDVPRLRKAGLIR